MKDFLNNLTFEQQEQFNKYYTFLIKQNKLMNLTAITDKEEVYIKHFYDSLLVGKIIDFNQFNSICDIGSGAGFPSIPLKIVYPKIKVTIIEPIKKRVYFLNELISLLKLENVVIINGRAEDVIGQYRESFDIVTARAVARLNILLELCVPFVRVKGYFIAMKGSNYLPEFAEAKRALNTLNGRLEDIELFELPNDMGQRALIKITKTTPTNLLYPRHFSKIKKNPL